MKIMSSVMQNFTARVCETCQIRFGFHEDTRDVQSWVSQVWPAGHRFACPTIRFSSPRRTVEEHLCLCIPVPLTFHRRVADQMIADRATLDRHDH
eukprot:2601070-Pyramimonas_sp.AAC.1